MPANLNTIVLTYLNDKEFQDEAQRIMQSRSSSLPNLRRVIEPFIDGTDNLVTFREKIDKALSAKDTWGARGTVFLMELNKLAKNHLVNADSSVNSTVEQILRQVLTGLNGENVGVRIEQWHTFLLEERERFKREGRPRLTNASPGNSALMISLFAHWLDWAKSQVIYYPSLLTGLKMLVDAGALQQVAGLRFKQDKVVVSTAQDHEAVTQQLDILIDVAPDLQQLDPPMTVVQNVRITYWVERFMFWITNHPEALESDEGDNNPLIPTVRVLSHSNVNPMPEERLRERIQELRQKVLIDEKVVRQIYHALLAGHVILTGPPGTGKTVLARYIPEILWRSDEVSPDREPTNYATHLVTATDEWSTRTLIGGLAPFSEKGQVAYRVRYGELTETIRKNWSVDANDPQCWGESRVSVYAPGCTEEDYRVREFRGLWLVIDEFNRAPIDLALGPALTSLSNGSGGTLAVPTDYGTANLPLPRDFRIIGTLNSFDRNYLNQISEALKRRFSFIEILPPSRALRGEEQRMVLGKALQDIDHMRPPIRDDVDSDVLSLFDYIDHLVDRGVNDRGLFPALSDFLVAAWRLFEVIRIYRQLGTAQAIAFMRHIFIAGMQQLESYPDNREEWQELLDDACCSTLVDQLQVLLPDELEVLIWYMKGIAGGEFVKRYNDQLGILVPRRRQAQLEALSRVVDENGQALLTDEQVEMLLQQTTPTVPDDVLPYLFHLNEPTLPLPQSARRLRMFKAERGL
jgi:AAA domain (dynein-related subfamily)